MHDVDEMGVRGGQGRTANEIHNDALLWSILVVVATVCLFVLAGCQRLERLGPFGS